MVGQRFGKLTVIAEAPIYKSPKGKRRRRWQCLCDCGRISVVKATHLLTGHTTSCGCTRTSVLRFANLRRMRERKNVGHRPHGGSFKRAVKRRDREKCFVCKGQERLEVHHLYNFVDHKILATNRSNGLTLCHKCHVEFHTWLGGFYVPCRPKDLMCWLLAKGLTWETIVFEWWRRSLAD